MILDLYSGLIVDKDKNMKKYFICTDEQRIDIELCLKSCRLNDRCCPKAVLKMVGTNRKWEGIPSTTQLQKGTREAFLELKYEYAIKPKKSVSATLGSGMHSKLENWSSFEDLTEKRLTLDDISGQFDLVERQENGENWLIDYKTTGAYKVKLALEGDFEEWQYQLNNYRLMLENQGIKIDKIRVFAIVKDGNTWQAKKDGIDEGCYYIDIPFIPAMQVNNYFQFKKNALLNALKTDILPGYCNDEETWHGIKCESWCNVKKWCNPLVKEKVIKVNKKQLEKELKEN
jgi:hypothetical protein